MKTLRFIEFNKSLNINKILIKLTYDTIEKKYLKYDEDLTYLK